MEEADLLIFVVLLVLFIVGLLNGRKTVRSKPLPEAEEEDYNYNDNTNHHKNLEMSTVNSNIDYQSLETLSVDHEMVPALETHDNESEENSCEEKEIEQERRSNIEFNLKEAVIYSEILKTKF